MIVRSPFSFRMGKLLRRWSYPGIFMLHVWTYGERLVFLRTMVGSAHSGNSSMLWWAGSGVVADGPKCSIMWWMPSN